MKILFLAQTPLGVRGTSGTYLVIEEISKSHDVLVISPVPNQMMQKHITYESHIKEIFIDNISNMSGILEIKKCVSTFQPKIIYMFNAQNNFKYIFFLSGVFPRIKWVLDVKTPLLLKGPARKITRKQHFALQFYTDLIFTLERNSVKTWIPLLVRKTIEYPLGINTTNFEPKLSHEKRINCRKFVFVGSIHRYRKLDLLVEFFSLLVREHPSLNLTLDLYGSGPEEETLSALINKNSLGNTIRFRGLLNQKSLFKIMSTYDAGIAYVPYEKYNKSPSLKAIEYAAAGIPVIASDTLGHKKQMLNGLTFTLFSNTKHSFISAIKNAATTGIPREQVINNIEHIHRYDMKEITRKYILPKLKELIKPK